MNANFFCASMGLLLAAVNASAAYAQPYPAKPVRLVTSAPGGGTDFTARLLAQGLTAQLGQQFVVDNRGGSHVPANTVGHAPADGYTLLVQNNTLWVAPLMEKTAYAMTQFAPVSLLSRSLNVLVVHPSLPVHSVNDLIALAKAKPGEINYASGLVGSANFLAAEIFKQMAGVNLTRISYKGGGPALTDVLGGQVKVMFATTGSVMPHIKSNRLRALAVTSAEATPLVPGLPPIAASVPGYESLTFTGLFVPAKTPLAIIQRLYETAVKVANQPEIKERYLASGVEALASTPQELGAAVKADAARVQKMMQATGLRAE
ncbi:MAG: tripartite tricarboxylate transporter substrate binding protein [Betaproteobacteria bacterium]|nr:tripartite tricarboxylate transporter substrate binding protein [Betaproteobacteria bacterium]